MNSSNDTLAAKGMGRLFILSAPSGTGKTTLCRALMKHFKDMRYSVSYTTREPRKGEVSGIDYHFISREAFAEKIKEGKWAEWAEVHGNFYGTSAGFLDEALSSGRDVLLDIDVDGTRQILKRYPDSVTVFIMPPDLGILRKRIESRGSESREVIEMRLKNAEMEMAQKDLYKHVIINDSLDEAVADIVSIVEKYGKGGRQ
ncbi:MAG: guanylate kinase [Thermodesulfobacteriota bacterium]|nr:guanylate kinase [Thermodesulfobacteriota bacterium]